MTTILILNAASSLIAAAGLTALTVWRRTRAARDATGRIRPAYIATRR